jgi:DNA-binding NtrC family response regulator
VRELENCVERAVVMSSDNSVSLDLLPEEIRENQSQTGDSLIPENPSDPQSGLRQAVLNFLKSCNNPGGTRDLLIETVEETLLRYLLDSRSYSQRELADVLSLSRVTLRKKLDHYKLS